MKDLSRWLLAESFVIVIGSVMIFGLVEYSANVLMGMNPHYRPIDSIGMLVPMGLLMGLISYSFGRRTNRYIRYLASGIARVAGGDFEVRLDPKFAGPLSEVAQGLNAMGAELSQVQTLRDDFTNMFSHEFRTPISSINGFARLLLEQDLDEVDQRRYLGIIAAESARLADLATNTLLLTQLESQQLVGRQEVFSLDEQIRRAAILLSDQWTAKSIKLTVDLEAATLRGNTDLLNQVWVNLLGNAIKFTPASGAIELALRAHKSQVVVTVSDSGPGIAENDLPRVFDKYFQGRTTVPQKGLGLGLTISRRIVELSGGRIQVYSNPGKGCVFSVTLPNP